MSILAYNIIHLLKTYVTLYQFKKYDDIVSFLSNSISSNSNLEKSMKQESLGEMTPEEVEAELNLLDKHRIFSQKPEILVSFYLVVAHYFLLKQKYDITTRILRKRVINSTVLNGRQTTQYFETKYYLKFILFILSTTNCKKIF